jgi:diaminopimelate epimerase
MRIPFTKAHGALNDFLLTWVAEAPAAELIERAAISICHRYSGVGADGWLLVTPPSDAEPAAIRLFNSDGSEPEISGNGTRCAAAFLTDAGLVDKEIPIRTGAGLKQLRLIGRDGRRFSFEMNMGTPRIGAGDLHFTLPVSGTERECTILEVGNPQCVFFVDDFHFDWKGLGAEVERHSHFPNRTNVSFVKVLDRHTIDARFFERGAGFTMSSGTGSTGAFFASVARGLLDSRATVQTLAGPLAFRIEGVEVLMQGPAAIVAAGEYYFEAAP